MRRGYQLDCVDQREGKYHAGASAIVRITLRDGTYHEDTGYGMIENLKGKGACLQKVRGFDLAAF